MLRDPRAIAAARVLAGLSQRDLAAAAGVAVSVVQALEQGASDPRNSTLLAIADALRARGVRILPEGNGVVTGVVLESLQPRSPKGRRSAGSGDPET